ncbi:LPS export ABC transporter ATP-binding protein [bacterium]|nr:MAG: LPS export ABC transporter ATP-binding protein [bacterium]
MGVETLKADNLVKVYRRKSVVKKLSIDVSPGEIVGLLGPNGAGKTTTFYMMVGLVRPNGGSVFLGDNEITSFPMHRRARMGLSYLPQEPSVFRKLTVKENILAILELSGHSSKESDKLADGYLKELSIENLAGQKAYTLSGGERRRVEIARALITSPRYLLLDEPFSGIDPIVVGELKEIIVKLKEKGMGILITDHNVHEVLTIVDRAYIIYEGQVLISGTSKYLLDNPDARRIYLGERFRMG